MQLLHLFHQENLCWEVVVIAVQEHAAAISTQWVALTVALLSLQEVAVKRLATQESELWFVLAVTIFSEESVAHDLVEEIPLTFISQSANSLCKHVPEGVEHFTGTVHVLNVTLSTHSLGTSLVHWVVVKVAHEDDSNVIAMNVDQRVDGATAHVTGSLALGA